MRRCAVFFCLLMLSCGSNDKPEAAPAAGDTIQPVALEAAPPAQPAPDFAAVEEASGFVTGYVVVADTGTAYFPLRTKMFTLHSALGQPIDTLGRGYDAKKDLIALPEDAEDEIYAGDYFPRRYSDAALSLEYLSVYRKGSGNKTIALVTGIYPQPQAADSALRALIPHAPKAFVHKADIYMGCLH